MHTVMMNQPLPESLGITLFFIGNNPPARLATGQPQRTAVKLIQQQQVLGAAAIFALCRLTLATAKIAQIHQKKMQLNVLAFCPALNQFTLFSQRTQLAVIQALVVAQPHIQIAGARLRQRADTAH